MFFVICEKYPNKEIKQITIDFEKVVILVVKKVLTK